MDPQAAGAGGCDGLGVDRAGIAIKYDIGDALVAAGLLKKRLPVRQRIAKGNLLRAVAPESLIAGVEANAPDAAACGAQHLAQSVEERSVRPLQEQENASILAMGLHQGTITF